MQPPDPFYGRVINAFEARQYWKKVRTLWEGASRDIGKEIEEIPDAQLKAGVIGIIQAVSSGQGHFVLEHTKDGFAIESIEIDDPVFDKLSAEGSEDVLNDAHTWIKACVEKLPAVYVGWAFGELKVRTESLNLNAREEELFCFSWERIAYSAKYRKILGVQTHEKAYHPSNKFIPVEMYAKET